MTMLYTILGFSAFGVASRFGQLGIQKRNIFSSACSSKDTAKKSSWIPERLLTDPAGHAIAAVVFGYAGYWAYIWEQRADELLALKRTEISERRLREAARTQALDVNTLADSH